MGGPWRCPSLFIYKVRQYLLPTLTPRGAGQLGRFCLGTVRGKGLFRLRSWAQTPNHPHALQECLGLTPVPDEVKC